MANRSRIFKLKKLICNFSQQTDTDDGEDIQNSDSSEEVNNDNPVAVNVDKTADNVVIGIHVMDENNPVADIREDANIPVDQGAGSEVEGVPAKRVCRPRNLSSVSTQYDSEEANSRTSF